jgi:hypothetical protein
MPTSASDFRISGEKWRSSENCASDPLLKRHAVCMSKRSKYAVGIVGNDKTAHLANRREVNIVEND